jgi:integrase
METKITQKNKRGRPPTGCPKWEPEEHMWIARLLMPSGGRKPVPMRGIAEHEVERAHALAKRLAIRYRDGGYVDQDGGEVVNDYADKYYDAAERGEVGRKNRGAPQVTAGQRRARYTRWVAPVLGTETMSTVGPEPLRKLVRVLDEQIRVRQRFYDNPPPKGETRKGRKPGLSAKGAQNIWGECTAMFAEAASSKIESLRVRTDDPTRLVQPPMSTDDREMTALYPSELVALLSHPDVPVYRRVTYAVAAYSGLRAGECRALNKESPDFDHEMVYVRRQLRAAKKLGRTKTRAGRRSVPIEPALRPLLKVLVEVAGEGDPLLRLPPPEDCADLVRKDLVTAGCDREELFADDAERQPFNFHGLRHTCLTHWAVAAKPLPWLLTAAGHSSYDVTQGYIDQASVMRASFGRPHPPLPASLIKAVRSDPNSVRNYTKSVGNLAASLRPQRELKNRKSSRVAANDDARSAEKQAEPPRSFDASTAPLSDVQGRSADWTDPLDVLRATLDEPAAIVDLAVERAKRRATR